MKSSIFCFLFLLIICFSAAIAQIQDTAYNLVLQKMLSHSVREISVMEVANKPSNLIFLDAREKSEYNVSHLKDAVFVGYEYFDISTVKNVPKDGRIVVYCSVGYRSEKVAEQLVNAGYSHVSNLYGGIFEWMNEDLPVFDLNGNPTSKIHAYDIAWGIWLTKGDKFY